MLSEELIQVIRNQFVLDWHGRHGISHFRRVRENGLILAQYTGAKTNVVELFAYLHDSQRWNEGRDPQHGQRAADYVINLQGELIHLSDEDLELLTTACEEHHGRFTPGDITVQTCFDADRLDLGRIGIRPRAEKLFTKAAKDPSMIRWAYENSLSRHTREDC